MKKLGLTLAALLLTACGLQTLPQPTAQLKAVLPSQLQRLSTPKQAVSAKTGLPIALQEIKQLDPSAQLYEIDIWQEQSGKSLHYGFLPASQSNGDALRVIVNVETQQVNVEKIFQASQIKPVNQSYWKLDNEIIYARAQENGLRDQSYLATLWDDTWHISGLKQDLYFQIDAQHGAIKLRCIGPYLDNCTDGDGTPVQRKQNQGWQQHTRARHLPRKP